MAPPPSLASQLRASLPEWAVPAENGSPSGSSNAGVIGAVTAVVAIAVSVAWLTKRRTRSAQQEAQDAPDGTQPASGSASSSASAAPLGHNSSQASSASEGAAAAPVAPSVAPPTTTSAPARARPAAPVQVAPELVSQFNITTEQLAQLSKPAVNILADLHKYCRVRQRTVFHDAPVASPEQYVSLFQEDSTVLAPATQLLKCTTNSHGKIMVLLIGEPSRDVDLVALSASFDAKKRKPLRAARPERVQEILRSPVAGSDRPVSPLSLVFDVKREVVVVLSKSLRESQKSLAFPLLAHDASTIISASGLERFLEHIKHAPVIVDFDDMGAFKWPAAKDEASADADAVAA